jgi:hypothetical protein
MSADETRIFVKISGQANFVWEIDDVKLAKDLVNTDSANIKDIVTSYRGISSVSTEFSPFWKSIFPENVDRIIIKKI